MKKLGKITAFILVFAAVLGGIVYSLNQASGQIQNEEAQLIEQRIEQAAVLCYTLEGSYPDEVSYLEQNYGVVIDHAKYNVFYQSLGSNLKPEVAVYRKGAAR